MAMLLVRRARNICHTYNISFIQIDEILLWSRYYEKYET